MENVIEIFKDISKIQRCSGVHHQFVKYIQKLSFNLGYECLVDKSHNILCRKANSNSILAFQAHYDIVCLRDDFTTPVIIEEGDTLKAQDSTLGSDNGIGCAYMIALMESGIDCEFIFTSDEEIGLVGANSFDLDINAKYMLNLDSEQEGEICIGCAGGVDIIAKNNKKTIVQNIENLELYEISISDLQGGHSGVDIDKNIPNAIKLLVKTIKECKGKVLDINGGERINSIPANAKAIVATKNIPIKTCENMKIEKIDTKSDHFVLYDDNIIDFIYNFEDGVRDFNNDLNVVQDSINLAKIVTCIDEIKIEISARSMSNTNLEKLKNSTKDELEKLGFEVKTYGKYVAWYPDKNEFTSKVFEIYKKYDDDVSLKAIHAGLECAIFKDKFTQLQIASIGPTINFPHSKKESVSISSVNRVFEIVKEIASSFKN